MRRVGLKRSSMTSKKKVVRTRLKEVRNITVRVPSALSPQGPHYLRYFRYFTLFSYPAPPYRCPEQSAQAARVGLGRQQAITPAGHIPYTPCPAGFGLLSW